MTPRQQPPQQPPPVQRLLIRYAKRGRVRFCSHRDFARAFERALRRAGIPMAYSSGFNPHQRVSYANPAPTGATSEAEYVEIALATRCAPGRVGEALAAVLPEGFAILDVVEVPKLSWTALLDASEWDVDLVDAEDSGTRDMVAGTRRSVTSSRVPATGSRDQAPVLDRAVAALVLAPSVEVERDTKSGPRRFDVKPAVASIARSGDTSVTVVLRHVTPAVRPDDVAVALRAVCPDLAGDQPPLVHRRTQGVLRQDCAIGNVLAWENQ